MPGTVLSMQNIYLVKKNYANPPEGDTKPPEDSASMKFVYHQLNGFYLLDNCLYCSHCTNYQVGFLLFVDFNIEIPMLIESEPNTFSYFLSIYFQATHH